MMMKLSNYSTLSKRTKHDQLVSAAVALRRYKSKHYVLGIGRKISLIEKNHKLLDFIAEDDGHPLNCISNINYKLQYFCKK